MAQESNMDLAYFESLESKSVALSQQLTAHILKVQDQMQQVVHQFFTDFIPSNIQNRCRHQLLNMDLLIN